MTTVFLDAVFKPFFKIVHDAGQELMIDRANFLTDGFLQIIQRTGFVSINTRFQITPQRKKWHIERSGERGGHGTSPKREMRCLGNMFWTMVTDSFAVCAVAPSCWNHTFAQFILLWRSSEYYPFKRCLVPVGHPVLYLRALGYDSLWPGRSRDWILVGWDFPHPSKPNLGTKQPPVQWVPEGRWPGRGGDYALATNTEVRERL